MPIEVTLNGKTQTVSKHQLFALASRGTIGPETIIYVDGRPVPAKKAQGIVFEEHLIIEEQSEPISVPSTVPAFWYYYDPAGTRQGPYTATQLKQAALRGIICPTTVIENAGGRQETANKVNGMVFSTAPVPVTRPEVYPIARQNLPAPPPATLTHPTEAFHRPLTPPNTGGNYRYVYKIFAIVSLMLFVAVAAGIGGFEMGKAQNANTPIAVANNTADAKVAVNAVETPPINETVEVLIISPEPAPPVEPVVASAPPDPLPPQPAQPAPPQPAEPAPPAPPKPVKKEPITGTIIVDCLEWGLPLHGATYSLYIDGKEFDSVEVPKDFATTHMFCDVPIVVGSTIETRIKFKNGYGQAMEERRVKVHIDTWDDDMMPSGRMSVQKYGTSWTLKLKEAFPKTYSGYKAEQAAKGK